MFDQLLPESWGPTNIKKYCHCKDSLTGIIVQAIKTSV